MTADKFRFTTVGGVLGLVRQEGEQQRRFVDLRKDVSGVSRLERIRLDRRALTSTDTSASAPPENGNARLWVEILFRALQRPGQTESFAYRRFAGLSPELFGQGSE